MNERQLEFVTFVIGSLAEKMNKPAADIYLQLKQGGIINDYIVPCYDVLHSFSKEYIVNDIIELMKEKGVYKC